MAVNNFFPALQARGPMPAFYAAQENARANDAAAMQQQLIQNRLAQEQQARQKQEAYNMLLQNYIGPDGAGLVSAPGAAPAPEQQNVLGQLYALDPERTNALVQFQSGRASAAQQANQQRAQEAVREAQFVLQSKNPKALMEVSMPDVVENLRGKGVDWDTATDEDVRRYAQMVLEHAGPAAGISPPGGGEPFTLGKDQVRFDARGNVIARGPESSDAEKDPTDKQFTRANVLRDEYTTATKDYSTIAAQYGNILATAQSPSAAGDISLLTSYMKMLDPASTVREGEFANAENAGGIPTKIRAQYNKALTGERLTEDQRMDFVTQAGNLFGQRRKQAQSARDRYSTLSQRYGIDPRDVVGTEGLWEPPKAAASGGIGVGQSATLNGFTITRKK
jgi:hypothetical protein